MEEERTFTNIHKNVIISIVIFMQTTLAELAIEFPLSSLSRLFFPTVLTSIFSLEYVSYLL